MSTFDLRAIIREEAQKPPHGPDAIAARVLKRIGVAHRLEALEYALPYVVRNVVTLDRIQSGPAMDADNPDNLLPGGADSYCEKRPAVTRKQTPKGAALSAKIAAVHSETGRTALLDTLYPDAHKRWVKLGDFTREDVLALVDRQTEVINRNAARRDAFQRVADEMEAQGVDRLGDLENATAILKGATSHV